VDAGMILYEAADKDHETIVLNQHIDFWFSERRTAAGPEN
jgi:hypothetical protein